MIRLLVGGAVGALIGGLIGYFTKCAGGGGCPMTGNPVGGLSAKKKYSELLDSVLAPH